MLVLLFIVSMSFYVRTEHKLIKARTYACSIISTVLQQCDVGASMSYYSWSIAIVIFSYISYWLFLVVIVFTLNAMLRRQLDVGHSNTVYKIIPLAIVGIMGLLSCALAGLTAYTNHSLATSRFLSASSDLYLIIIDQTRLNLAYWVLYLVSVLVSGALALMTILSLRKAGKAGGVSQDTDVSNEATANDMTIGSHRLGNSSHHCHGTLGNLFDRLRFMGPFGQLRLHMGGQSGLGLSHQLYPGS
jgi:hypothetical protein